jgi:tubulin polyglutamylase TTLL5
MINWNKMDEEVLLQENVEKIKQQKQNNSDSKIDPNREPTLFFRVVKNKSEVYDIITRAFGRKTRWNELPHGLDLRNSWNFMWSWSKIRIDISKLLVWQKWNHFPQSKQLWRKDNLKKNLERAMKSTNANQRHFYIMQETYVLPKEYVAFIEAFSDSEEAEGRTNYWIIKPAAKSRGRGISVINDITSVNYGEPIVVQRYLKNPMLLNGFKFDMRIYVLVTSFNPLEAFIYREGFARLSTTPFSLDPEKMSNKFVHLTNYSIQKNSATKDECEEIDSVYGGTKISLTSLKQYFKKKGLNYEDMWEQWIEIWVKSLVACQNEIPYNPWWFELLGYDIIIDDLGKWWLIEVNSSPSLARDHLLDDIIKQRLIDDTIDLVEPIDYDRKRLFEVLERRITQDFKQSTSKSGTNAKKHIMNEDLTYILNGAMPRAYGEDPKMCGNYQRIAPTKISDKYIKFLGGQKMFGSLMKINPSKEDTTQATSNSEDSSVPGS